MALDSTLDSRVQAALALHRFGLGPRDGSIAAIAADPRGALLAELATPGAGLIPAATLPSSQEAVRAVFEFREEQRARATVQAERQRVAEAERQRAGDAAAGDTMEMKTDVASDAAASPADREPPLPQQIVL